MLVYEFGPEADFEGRLLGALERIESGGALRILDALFVGSDPGSGELVAVGFHSSGAAGFVEPLLRFRLEPAERRRATQRTLAAEGLGEETLRRLAAALGPGGAMLALLVEHNWLQGVEDAVARTGGRRMAADFVDARSLSELASELLSLPGRA